MSKSLLKFPKLFPFQESAKEKVLQAFTNHRGHYLIANTGYGKTFIYGQLIYEMIASGKLYKRFTSPHRALIITKATAVEKTRRDMLRWGMKYPEVFVTNYDALRSSKGEIYIEEFTEVIRGEERISFRWNPVLAPSLVVFDEGHALKNPKSLQHRISVSIHKIPDVLTLCVSATTFSNVAEARYFALLSGALVEYGYSDEYNVDAAWGSFSQQIAGNTDPNDFSPAAMQRLRTVLNPYITQVPHISTKYKSYNSVKLVNFLTKQDQLEYAEAYAKYLEKLASIDRDAPGGIAAVWVANLMFRIAAEKLRARIIAHAMLAAWKGGKSPIAAVNFRQTAKLIVEELHVLGVDRKLISLIWGGIPSKDDEYDLDLGPQTREERQRNIDRFQLGKSQFCIFTYKAGGCALSLHHANDHDGTPVEFSRPRESFLSVAYSVFEIRQGVGRAQRITSLSNTYQTFLLFAGTIEEQVAAKLAEKLKSLGAFHQENESWYDMIAEGTNLDRNNTTLTPEELEESEGTYVENDSNTEGEESLLLPS